MNAKVDADMQDSKSGRTALHHSVEKGDLPMAGYLITEVRACPSVEYSTQRGEQDCLQEGEQS